MLLSEAQQILRKHGYRLVERYEPWTKVDLLVKLRDFFDKKPIEEIEKAVDLLWTEDTPEKFTLEDAFNAVVYELYHHKNY